MRKRASCLTTCLICVYLVLPFVSVKINYFSLTGKMIKGWLWYALYGVLTKKSKKSLRSFPGLNF